MSSPDPERWGKLQALFRELVDAAPGDRAARLAQVAQQDAALAQEARELLTADSDALQSETLTRRLSGAVQQLAGELEGERGQPAWIGDYRIRSVLGSGGMGVVYLAEQESPRRTVALKVIRAFGGANAVRRFQREAELHGRLQHPGIALVHEAGMAAERDAAGKPFGPARPFFAMEFVDGEAVNAFVQTHALGVEARVDLMARICDAIEHAHSRGVIHRDLKSANVLVDRAGNPKVLDFGIARAVDRDHAGTLQTAVGEVVGTLPYMSPEQVSGDPLSVGVASDIYALGVVLFEALTGRRPLDLAGRTLPEAVRIVTDDEPTRLGAIDRALRGDLETIVGRCLEKDPRRRYASAGALAQDLRHHLAHRPIDARPASTYYQVAKFARRHRPLVIGVATAFVALTAATAVSVTMAYRAEQARGDLEQQLRVARIEAARSTQSFDFLRNLLTAADPARSAGKEMTVHQLVLDAAEGLRKSDSTDNQVTGMLARLVGFTLYRLGDLDAAERTLKRSVELLRHPDPNAVGADDTLVQAMVELGDLLRARDKSDEAAAVLTEATDLRRSAVRAAYAAQGVQAQPEQITDVSLGAALNNLSLVHQHRGDFAAAERCAREAHQIEEALVKAGWNRRPNAATALVNLAAAQLLQGHAREAEPRFREAVAIHEVLSGNEAPITQTVRNNLASALRSLGRYQEAIELIGKVQEIRRRTLPEGHFETATGDMNMAQALLAAGRPLDALECARRGLTSNERSLGERHQDTGRARSIVASVLDALGQSDEAGRQAETACADITAQLGGGHIRVADALVVLSTVARHRGEAAHARELAQRAAQVAQEAQGPRHPVVLKARQEAAHALLGVGDAAGAARELHALLGDLREELGAEHPLTGRAALLCAESERAAGNDAVAAAMAREAAAALATPGTVEPWMAQYAALLADVAQGGAGVARAEATQARAAEIRRQVAALGGPGCTELDRLQALDNR